MNTHTSLAGWLELWGHQADHTALKSIHDDLVKMYGEHHRHYHDLRHVSRCIDELTDARSLADHPFEVELSRGADPGSNPNPDSVKTSETLIKFKSLKPPANIITCT
jgi:hypothetical protein